MKNAKFIFSISFLLFVFACNNDDEINTDEYTASSIIEKLGDSNSLADITSVSYKVIGLNFEWEQPKPTAPNPLIGSNYEYVFSAELLSRKIRFDYDYVKYDNPYAYETYESKMIINDKQGTSSGTYNWTSFYFGQTEPVSFYANRIEAMLKNQKMANPLALLKEVVSREGNDAQTEDFIFRIPTRIENLDIELHIDKESGLPTKALIMEEDFLNGDVPFEIIYENWTVMDGMLFPSTMKYYLDGRIIRDDKISNLELNPTLEKEHFTPETVYVPLAFNEMLADQGVYFSQWYHRWQAWGIPNDQVLDNGALDLGEADLSSFKFLDQEVGPNLKIVGRPDLRTWAVAINTDDGIYVVDAPLNTYWTKSCVEAIKEGFPGKDIVGGIITHTHHVTFGGIRELATEIDKLYVGKEGVEIAETALNSDFTLVPDSYSQNQRDVEIIPVTSSNKIVIANGAIEIYRLVTSDPIGTDLSGPHSNDMCVIYVPEYKALIEADHFWTGEFMRIWDGKTANTYTERGRAELKRTGRYLYDFVKEKNLDVELFISIHGGVDTPAELEKIVQ